MPPRWRVRSSCSAAPSRAVDRRRWRRHLLGGHGGAGELAEASGIPVAETQAGRGALASSHPLCLGGVGATGTAAAAEAASVADLVIGVGTRWSDFTTASRSAFADPGLEVINLNVNRGDALKLGGLPLLADARAGLEALRSALGGWRVRAEWSERVAGARRSWRGERERLVADTGVRPPSQPEIIGAVNEAAADDGVVVCAAGSMPGELHRLWDATGPGSYHVEYGYSCMGYELPGGIGTKLADPDRRVFVLVGDGSWLMMHGELLTAVLRGIAITVVLVDNGGYSSIGALSRSLGQGGFGTILAGPRDDGAEPVDGDDITPAPVDLAASAEALGARAIRVADAAELREALRESEGAPGPVVIRVPSDRFAETPSFGWWDVPVAEVSESEHVDRARALHGAALASRRTSLRRTG
ncbi:MAG: thiamine pyrophosphate-dependent enzyme [Solirubrobacterales bacterium]